MTEKACQEDEKVEAGETELSENNRLSPNTTIAVLCKTDSQPERRDGESAVEATKEVVCQGKYNTGAGDTEVTGNKRVSFDATGVVSCNTGAVPHSTYPTSKLREAESDQNLGKR